MLVTFKTDVGVITMFEDDAHIILKMMGHSTTTPGTIRAADVPVALSPPIKGCCSCRKIPPAPVENEDADEEPSVSMTHRALPLIDLLIATAKEGCDVMWH